MEPEQNMPSTKFNTPWEKEIRQFIIGGDYKRKNRFSLKF